MTFEEQLKGGHPNSLGNTIAVVEQVVKQTDQFEQLFQCYYSDDEVVRLRTSNAMKRIGKENLSLLIPYIDRFLEVISKIDQASTQWTLAQLFDMLETNMSPGQREKAVTIMKDNLTNHTDWIVLTQTMNTLARWSKEDLELRNWLLPQLERLSADQRKSVSGRARKTRQRLED